MMSEDWSVRHIEQANQNLTIEQPTIGQPTIQPSLLSLTMSGWQAKPLRSEY